MKGVTDFIKTLLKDTLKTVFTLFRIMIPVSIVVKVLQEAGMVQLIGDALFPVMKYVGLPGEMGLVWATGMITNLFGGIIAYLNIAGDVPLSVAQISSLGIMMLVAHTFPIELAIARKTGSRIVFMFLFRFIFAWLFGMAVFWSYKALGIYNYPAEAAWIPDKVAGQGLADWALNELKNYLVIVLFIFSLILLLRILKITGILNLLSRSLNPFLRFLGIGNEVITISLLGLTMGIVYGGALIISETRNNAQISRRDVFYAMCLMGLCHSIIEDTILIISLGADIFSILLLRILFTVLVIFTLVRITRNVPDKIMNKYFLVPKKI